MDYQPACYQCRVDADKDIAGVKETSLCVPHLKLRCADLTRQLAEARAEIVSLKAQLSPLSSATPPYVKGLEKEIARLRKALENLVEKLFLVHDDPEYVAVWSIYQAHVHDGYKGLTYTKEIDEAKTVLEASDG